MKGVIATILFLHAMISASHWRKYLQANQQQSFMPYDIALEILLATMLSILSILSHTSRLKVLREFIQIPRYLGGDLVMTLALIAKIQRITTVLVLNSFSPQQRSSLGLKNFA